MQGRLTAYPPDQAAIACPLDPAAALRIGRAVGDGLRLDHPSVSRHHAELAYRDGAWRLRDLGSKNGSFVDGIRVHDMPLARACWLRLGDIYLEFSPISAAEAEASERGQRQRRASISARTARLDGLAQLDDLLEASLRGVVELAQCERGFVLLAQGDRFAVRASLALTPAQLSSSAFSGSVSAIRRALDQRRSVVVNEIGLDPWLASRASVVAGDLNAVVCLPLLDGRQALGAIYADRVRPGPAITTLDLELLEAFGETASLWLAARRTSDLLAGVESDLDWDAIVAAHEAAP
jgi:hypothetical protein